MRRRGRTDANQSDVVAALRAVGCNVWITSGCGAGAPDLVVYRPATGLLRLVELKDGTKPPSARKLTPDEKAFARLFPVWVVTSVQEAYAAMQLLPEGSPT